ncbi:MAG: PDR/VanB family oxidoreductase [Mycobacterium sp.]
MADVDTPLTQQRRLTRLLKPYTGEPPPSLYRAGSQDRLIRFVGTAVPHFLSALMRLGGDQELPEFPHIANRRPMLVAERRVVATDDDVVELTLIARDGSTLRGWHAGAHIDVYLPSGRTRQYSLCGDPGREREYRIAVRRIAGGGGGSVEMHTLEVGQTVEISDPRNAFMMPLPGSASRAEKVHFIAGGIGITPILPMARLAAGLGVPWSLCYTGRHRMSMPFVDELLELGDHVTVRTDAEHGLPSAAELLDGVEQGRTAVFACGPPLMIESVRRSIPLDSGTELHVERFSPLPVVDGLPFELVLARSGEVVDVRGDQSALAALRQARPNVSYSCQQGFCGTCVQKVLSGEVEHRDSHLTDLQRESGQVLVCVSRATPDSGPLVLDV